GLSVNVSFFSPGFLVSLIQYCFFLLPRRAHSVRAHYIRGRHYGAAAVIESGDFPDRYRIKRATRARNVSLAGPASTAACTTFGRFNAKSKSSPGNASISAISPFWD